MMEFVDILINELSVEIPHYSNLLITEVDHPGLIPFRCKQGICGSCRVEIIKGHENLSEISQSEFDFLLKLGDDPNVVRLACQTIISGTVKLQTTKKYSNKRSKGLP